MSTPSFRRLLRRAPLWLAMFVAVPAIAQSAVPGYEVPRAAVYRAEAGRVLGAAVLASERGQAVASALRTRGRDAATVAALREAGAAAGLNGFTHVRLEQSVEGLAVYGTYAKAAFDRNGQLVHLIDQLARVPVGALPAASVDARQALQAAMARVHPAVAASFTPAGATGANRLEFDGGPFFHGRPSVEAVAVPLADGSMARGWLVQTWTQRSNQLHHTLVSGDGRVLFVESRTARDSYNVFPIDPGKGAQAIVAGPGTGNAQSPIGWLDGGTQSTINIAGNNVNAYLDASNNNKPDRGGTAVTDGNFLTAAVLTQSPTTSANMAVAVQNLFFHNNLIHDRLYRHGFTEATGNFQNDNFGLGGKGRDAVNAEAQDGSGTDNANFATPPDGQKPRMQMYLWTGPGATHEVAVSGGANYGGAGSAFGPAFTTTGVTGAITPTEPADGCGAISTALAGRIALIDRGTCQFTAKVLNAQAAGAVAVVIANNDQAHADTFFGPGAGDGARRVRIPSLMVSYNSGLALKALGTPTATARQLAVQPLQLDASLDSDIVYHEYCHGLTWRMIGGMSGPVAGAIGEGMADGCSMLINGDDKVGEYSASNPNGIRRFPYAGYPLTYADVNGAEVHDDGEIYAAIVWSLITRFDAAYPGTGRDRLFGYLVDGMNFTPATPMFEDMRSGILQAVGGTPGSADRCHVWRAFAQFGVGDGSSAVINSSTSVTTTPSSTRGEGCTP